MKATLEGLQRSLAKPVVKKEPITFEMLEAMVDDANKSCSLSNLRLVTACLLSFAGFLRFDEMINLRPCDFALSQEMLKIRIVRLISCGRVMRFWWLELIVVLAQ